MAGDCMESAKKQQGACKKGARRAQRNGKEDARNLAVTTLQRGCKETARRGREGCEEGATKLQGGSRRGQLWDGCPVPPPGCPCRPRAVLAAGQEAPGARSSALSLAPCPALHSDAARPGESFPGVRPERPPRSQDSVPGRAPRCPAPSTAVSLGRGRAGRAPEGARSSGDAAELWGRRGGIGLRARGFPEAFPVAPPPPF